MYIKFSMFSLKQILFEDKRGVYLSKYISEENDLMFYQKLFILGGRNMKKSKYSISQLLKYIVTYLDFC